MAYEVELAAKLAAVHPVLHISLLNKYVGEATYVLSLEIVPVKDSFLISMYELISLAVRLEV